MDALCTHIACKGDAVSHATEHDARGWGFAAVRERGISVCNDWGVPVSTQREQRQEMAGAAGQPRIGPYPHGGIRACKLLDARPAAAESGPDRNMRELQQALAGAAEAAMIINRNGIIEYVNPAFTALTGYTRDEAVGRTPALLRAGARRRDASIALWKAFAVHRQFHGLVVMRKKGGALFNADLVLWRFPDSRGSATHTIALCTDAGERVAAARRVIEDEMRRTTAAASASAWNASEPRTQNAMTCADNRG